MAPPANEVEVGAADTNAVIDNDESLETNLRVNKVAVTKEARARLAESSKTNPYPFTMADLAKAARDVGAFEIDENKSLYYMFRDFAIVGLSVCAQPLFLPFRLVR